MCVFATRRSVHSRPCATPLEGEAVIVARAASAFAASELEDLLDAAGATTVVLCGSLSAVEPSARDAANLGYTIEKPRNILTLRPNKIRLAN